MQNNRSFNPRRTTYLAASLLLLLFLLFFYLYRNNIIFVEYVEHGVLIKKATTQTGFKYDILIEGNLKTYFTEDESINLDTGVVNFVSRGDRIVQFSGYVQPLNEKIMSRRQKSIELEYSGDMQTVEKPSVYKKSSDNITVQGTGNIIVGAKNISTYKDKKGCIKTIIINGDPDLSFIRVGIKNEGFQSFNHHRLEFTSDDGLTIRNIKAAKVVSIPPKEKAILIPDGDYITLECPTDSYKLEGRIYIEPSGDSKIRTISYKRSYGTPDYRGDFEVTNVDKSLRLINEVNLENYLYQVVPSEMPLSFGVEALKAQAVAARTYAISDLLSGRYFGMGFHVDDSTMSQVYNNSKEHSVVSGAVDSTKALIMKYQGNLVDAKYHSTSHGYGANAHEIWSSNGDFPGDVKPYLTAVSYLLNNAEYKLSTEEDAKRFFKDWSLKSYDSNSPYYRWKVTFLKDELKNTIEKNLPLVYNDQNNYILTLVNGEYVSREIPQGCLGDLKNLNVTRRGQGGNIMELVISGTKGTYKIIKELNVRYVLRPRKSDTGLDRDIIIKRAKGEDLKNSSLLPSAFMIHEISRSPQGDIIDITFWGGGYGHSVGMSQYGAAYLASKGYKYDQILKTYYVGASLEKLY